MAAHVRDELIRALTARIRRFLMTYDHDAVLSPEALVLVRELMGCVPDPARDPEAVRAIAGLHRCRALLLTGDRARRDAAVADALEPLAAQGEQPEDLARDVAAAGLLQGAMERVTDLTAAAEAAVARVERDPDHERMTETLEACRTAVEQIPDELLPFRASPLQNWGIALRLRYERHHDLTDLHESIARLRQAKTLAGPGHPARRAILTGLGVALRVRYERVNALEDLRDAVRYAREAATAPHYGSAYGSEDPDEDRHNYGGRLHNLGLALRLLHERLGRPEDLAESIRWHREAVAVTPPGHPGYAIFQLGLGNALANHDDGTAGGQGEAGERLAAYEEAAARATGVELRAAAAGALASALVDTGEDADRLANLDRAERHCRDALAALPEGHSVRAAVRYQLGRALLARYTRGDRRPADLAEALACHSAAARQPTGAARVRLLSAAHWGTEAMALDDPAQAVEAYGLAVELLPRLAARHLALSDAEHALAGLPYLASDAAACALRAGDPERAVSLLEMGRGVLLARGIQGRDDFAELRRRAPELAERLTSLREALDAPDGSDGDDRARDDRTDADIRHVRAREWDDLLAEIRTGVPGFERFLLPPSVARLREQAVDGPVVLVNVSRFGSAALVLARAGLRVVPLPELTLEAAETEANALLNALARLTDPATGLMEHPDHQDRIDATLRWLWNTVAGPVLDALSITGPGGERRLWWVPTGPLVVLPLHAAGHHREPETDGRTVLDRAVSSYAPTVQALAHARRGGESGAAATALVAAVPEAPGAPRLPRAAEEAAAVAALLPGARVLLGAAAHREALVTGLAQHPWLHFSGHAVADPAKPSASRLLVHDHLEHPLTVADISRLDLRGAELAYLSACGTAHAGLRLADESLHLTSALQLAGYRHVVGSLWSVEDTVSKEIAKVFYETPGLPDHPARAVHRAVRAGRAAYPDAPSHWAAHIHVGT
ncbi:CHAT domain-containing protein [Streptomyces sp. NPDC052236]|uniref:CHAT domain-containing protein n=1 Tax=Streptomyces sp. NPDC052236 TaxID=3365686 RepID=UPI0037CE0117